MVLHAESPVTAAVRPRKGENEVMSTTTSKPSKVATLTLMQALIAGTQKHFPTSTFTLGGTAYTTATLVQVLEDLVSALSALSAAHVRVKDAGLTLRGVESKVGPVL